MIIDDKIRDEKLQYDINRKTAKILALPWGKIDKYEYLTGEEILPSTQSRIIKQANFTYSPWGKALEKNKEKQMKNKEKTSWSFGSVKTRRKSRTKINWRTFSKRNENR